MTNRGEVLNVDSRLFNGYVETNANNELWCYKRPGTTLIYNADSATGRGGAGMYRWGAPGGSQALYSVFGGGGSAAIYKNGALLSALAAFDGLNYSFTDYLGATPGVFFHGDGFAYITDGTTVTQVTDPDYPTSTVYGSVFIDGTVYVMTPDNFILGSGINNPLSWDPLNSIQAQIQGGSAVAIAKQQNYLVAFKTTSTEVFYNAQNAAGSSLGRVEAASLSVGCSGGLASADGILYWVSTSATGQPSVMQMSGLKASVISNAAIERYLRVNFPESAFCVTLGGHKFYILVTTRDVLVYDIEEKFWSFWGDWAFGDSGTKPVWGVGNGNGVSFQTDSGGRIYDFRSDVYKDHGGNFTFDLYTPNFDGGVRYRKMVNQMEISADQVEGSELLCRFSDDDYQNWSDFRKFDLGLERPILQSWGTFRRRAHHFRHEQNLPLRLRYVDLHADLGTL
jgi:hypothetical protein